MCEERKTLQSGSLVILEEKGWWSIMRIQLRNEQYHTTAGGRLYLKRTCLVVSYMLARGIVSLHLLLDIMGVIIKKVTFWSCSIRVAKDWTLSQEACTVRNTRSWLFYLFFFLINLVFDDLSFAILCCFPPSCFISSKEHNPNPPFEWILFFSHIDIIV